jgi:glycosyltransferase involved in cell wall biosynthesis
MFTYTIITPVKNEVETLAKTIDSVTSQSILPTEWIVVNDASSDGSRNLLEELANRFSWVKLVDAPTIAKKDYSSRVIDLFNYGYSKLSTSIDLICKMDADVSFGKDFFKHILAHFEKNPKLAISSGHLHNNGVPESIDLDNVVCTRGATKVYRNSFLDEIGGLISYQGWDTLDNVAARAKGWQVLIVDEPFEHLKEEGVRVGKTIFRHIRNGYYNGSLPFYFPYFLIKIIVKSLDRPIFFSSVFMLWGYIKARMSRVKSPYPEYVIRQLRKEQKSYLMKKLNLV